MKTATIIGVIALLSFSSCSKCYECTYDIEILDANGNTTTEKSAPEDFCTADGNDLQAKEAEGYTCTSK